MLNEFFILHKKHPTGLESVPERDDLFAFKTCLRHIYFGHGDGESVFEDLAPEQGFEIYENVKAYQFALEVLCGLHSPVVGETEVFGQFKSFCQAGEFPYALKQIFNNIFTDVKRVRGQHLINLGGQSYGSLIRKLLSSPAHVSVVGAGVFVRDLLPWIYKDQNQIEVFARDPVKARRDLLSFSRLKVNHMGENKVTSSVAIIAAPLSSREIEELISSADTLVIDLRGESRKDPCTKFSNYQDLNEFFEKIQMNQSQILNAKALALTKIDEISQKRFYTENPRPFGWEDICVW
jgi:glutamyl-tRNA reductase